MRNSTVVVGSSPSEWIDRRICCRKGGGQSKISRERRRGDLREPRREQEKENKRGKNPRGRDGRKGEEEWRDGPIPLLDSGGCNKVNKEPCPTTWISVKQDALLSSYFSPFFFIFLFIYYYNFCFYHHFFHSSPALETKNQASPPSPGLNVFKNLNWFHYICTLYIREKASFFFLYDV